jgi:hypothetical protein
VIELPGLGVGISVLLYSTMRIIGSSPAKAASERYQVIGSSKWKVGCHVDGDHSDRGVIEDGCRAT